MPDAMQPVSKQVCSLVWLPPKSNLFFFLISIIFLFLIEFLFKNYKSGSALCNPKQGKDVLTTVGLRTHVNIWAFPSTPPLGSPRLMHVDALNLEFSPLLQKWNHTAHISLLLTFLTWNITAISHGKRCSSNSFF